MKWVKRDKDAPSVRADYIRVWMLELYSTKVGQAKNFLCLIDTDTKVESFCCLGIGSVLFGYKKKVCKDGYKDRRYFGKNEEDQSLPEHLFNFLKMDDDTGGFIRTDVETLDSIERFVKALDPSISFEKTYANRSSLAGLNDVGVSFKIIAKVIREYNDIIFEGLTPEDKQYIQATKLGD